jgi:hypothetical protein
MAMIGAMLLTEERKVPSVPTKRERLQIESVGASSYYNVSDYHG